MNDTTQQPTPMTLQELKAHCHKRLSEDMVSAARVIRALDAALSHPAPVVSDEAWKPIETAPKDGRRVLCGRAGGRGYVGYWCLGNNEWLENSGYAVGRDPTYWMPLPALPATRNSQ